MSSQPSGVQGFNVEYFEYTVARREYEEAARLLLQLLTGLDQHYGNLPSSFFARSYAEFRTLSDLHDHVFTRLASAVSALFSDPGFQWSEQGFRQAMPLQRWLALIYASTPFRNADHVIRSLNNFGWQSEPLQWRKEDMLKLAFLTVPDSMIPLDLDLLWASVPILAASMCVAWLSPRFLETAQAHRKREVVLEWLPERLARLRLEDLPLGILHDAYMHCSYASSAGKHRIKRVIHDLAHSMLTRHGLGDLPVRKAGELQFVDGKPVMLVVLEWFNTTHSVYRTHSSSLIAAREHFFLIGVGPLQTTDEHARKVFHRFIPWAGENLLDLVRLVRGVADENRVSVVYLPSVGMMFPSIAVASLRLAPIQVTALGHGASTQSPWIDYFAVEQDLMGERRTYSEQILELPSDGMPFVHSSLYQAPSSKADSRKNAKVVRIAVAASTMKLNPRFLQACARIRDSVSTPVHFEFLVGNSTQLVWPLVCRMAAEVLGQDATVHHRLPYSEYMEKLRTCDMFITPFPYGNMNGIADAVSLGLGGVCMSGSHVHESIDAGLFRRLELPPWTIASSVEEYVAAAVRMVDGHDERAALRSRLLKQGNVDKLYSGRPDVLALKLRQLVAEAGRR